MLFNSLHFLVFFPIVLLVYFCIPKNIRYIWLLAASYYFYMCWNAKYAVLILFSTVITYLSGIAIDWVKQHNWEEKKAIFYKKGILTASFVLNLGVLVYFKYANFFLDNIERILGACHIELNVPVIDVLLPVGISFYTFQALSYTMDVYRGDIYAEKNFFRYALFVSFFPQLVAGPIERSKNLLKQLAVPAKFDFEKAREGFLLMLWGFFLKIVVADRIAVFVDTVYGDYVTYTGWYLVVATVLFAFQIYCDFYGYSTIATGAAQLLGIQLMTNFETPYLSLSVKEFWRRWHISLSSWFRDYLYFPLGGSKKGTIRKYINIMIVFLVSGLWHGARWSFVIWGGLNGIFQLIGDLLKPVKDWFVKVFGFNRSSLAHKLICALVTFALVDFTWIFFRATGYKEAVEIAKGIFTAANPGIFWDGSLYNCGLDSKNFGVMLISIGILLFVDICNYLGVKVRNVILRQDIWFRWIFIAFSICAILIFGIWGSAFDEASFIYFQF